MTLPQALQPLAAYRQWITWQSVPQPDGQKPKKIPCDWRTGYVGADAHDPSIWTDYDTAALHGPVGFVFTAADPFWFLDIDNCAVDGQWSPLALDLCTQFAGAAIEVSVSGTGLHIIGVGNAPKHKKRNEALGLEFYTEARFMALGTGATGNAMTDHTSALQKLVADHFTLGASNDTPQEWTTGPCADYNGPASDDELLRRAIQSKSTAAAFGARASFADLWTANEPILKGAYPDPNRPFDANRADAALAQHLAFWTGKDCDRIVRLMWQSKLARAKWTEHPNYMTLTVGQAVAKQKDVCKDKPPAPAVAVTTVQAFDGDSYILPEGMVVLFAGCVYVTEPHAILMPGGELLNESRFNVMLGGYVYIIDRLTQKQAKHAWDAFVNTRDLRFPRVSRLEFDPSHPPGHIWHIEGTAVVNSYVPIKTASKKGNPKPFLDHLVRILPDVRDRDIVLAYMAAVVQHPGVKFQWAPLIQGAPGNGKTLLSRCVTEAVGRAHCHTPKSQELTSRFNDWIDRKIFIAVEDVFVSEQQAGLIEVLKPMITSDWQEIEGKGSNKVSRKVCANFMLNSNHKDAVKKSRDDRRFAIFYTHQQSMDDIIRDGMGGSYFPDLYNWLRREGYAIVTDYLQQYAIPDALNPAKDCHRAPLTSSTEEAITASVGRLEQEIIHAIEQEQIGFRGGWVSSHFLDALIKALGMERHCPRNKRSDLMLELGYRPHPGLNRGQVNNLINPDGCKPRLFITMGNHPAEYAMGGEVARLYSDTQDQVLPLLRVA